jgi:hypothetical protein
MDNTHQETVQSFQPQFLPTPGNGELTTFFSALRLTFSDGIRFAAFDVPLFITREEL